METTIHRSSNQPVFKEWEEYAQQRFPYLTEMVERYSGLPMSEPLHLHLEDRETRKRAFRRYIRNIVGHVPAEVPSVMAAVTVRGLAWFTGFSAVAEVRPGKPVTMHFDPQRHARQYKSRGYGWYWDYVFIHELTHHAQQQVKAWGLEEEVARTWSQDPRCTDALDLSSAVEGHADWVAKRWLDDHHPGCDPRKVDLQPRLWFKGFKLVMKPVQNKLFKDKSDTYKRGRDFTQAVFEHGGLELVNRMWSSIDMVPTRLETSHPDLWIGRVA